MIKDRLEFPINPSDIIAYCNLNVGLEICYVVEIQHNILKVRRFNDDGTIRDRVTELPHVNQCLVLGADTIPNKYWRTINELDHERVS